MMNNQFFHVCICIFTVFEIHIAAETPLYISAVIHISMRGNLDASIILVFRFCTVISLYPTHTGIAGPGSVAHFLFQIAYADAEVRQFVQCGFLFSIQLIFTSHQTGDHLSQFITGHVPFAFKCAVRITFYNALIGEIGYCLVGPVISGYIRKRICSVCGYACSECSSCCDCENFFHIPAPFHKTLRFQKYRIPKKKWTRVAVFPPSVFFAFPSCPWNPRTKIFLSYHIPL